MSYQVHFFICTNGVTNPEKCGSKDAEEIHAQLKKKCSPLFDKKQLRINKSGCLGHCEKGVVAVIYPHNQWFFNLKLSDIDFLFSNIEQAINEPPFAART